MHDASTPSTRIDWRSGGWVLLLALVLILAVSAWRVVPMLRSPGAAIGDGRNVESYGFDLTSLLVPRERIVAAGFPRDGIPALDAPSVMPGSAVDAFNESVRGKYLVAGDRVIGVTIGGESRAYPLRVLNWHEIVNDSLGGVPIAVTYHPLCDSVVVFDRRVEGELLVLGVSGLLYNSNLLLFDRRSQDRSMSLWSQLQARAVAGPAASRGRRLPVLAASLLSWGAWLERRPQTSVLRPDPDFLKRYQRNPYGNYLRTGKLRFPVQPLPPEESLPPMTGVVVVERDGRRRVFALDDGAVNGLDPSLEILSGDPPSVLAGDDVATFYALWFAWYSQHPQSYAESMTRDM